MLVSSKCSFTFFVFLLIFSRAFAQQGLEIKTEEDIQKNINVVCYNNESCDYLALFDWKRTPFVPKEHGRVTVHPGKNLIFSLPGIYAKVFYDRNVSLDLLTGFYIKGRMNTQVNDKIIYLMPVKGSSILVSRTANLDSLILNKAYSDWYSLEFHVKEGDTVFASRAGVVCDVNYGDKIRDAYAVYTNTSTNVEVFHKDGSFANYNLLKKDTIFVKKGQRIRPGDPIGLVDRTYNISSLLFTIYYLDISNVNFSEPLFPQKWYHSLTPGIFTEAGIITDFTQSRECTSSFPFDLMCQELSKKEKRKLEGK